MLTGNICEANKNIYLLCIDKFLNLKLKKKYIEDLLSNKRLVIRGVNSNFYFLKLCWSYF